MQFATKLAKVLSERGLIHKTFAEGITDKKGKQVYPSLFSFYVNGKHSIPDDIKVQIASKLDVTIEWLFYDKSFNTVVNRNSERSA